MMCLLLAQFMLRLNDPLQQLGHFLLFFVTQVLKGTHSRSLQALTGADVTHCRRYKKGWVPSC